MSKEKLTPEQLEQENAKLQETNKKISQDLALLQSKHTIVVGDNQELNEKLAHLLGGIAVSTLDEIQAAFDELKATGEGQKVLIIQLQDERDMLKEELEALKGEFEELMEKSVAEIERLNRELARRSKDAGKGIITTEVKGKLYRVLGKSFHTKLRGKVTLDELLEDQELKEHLVDIGSGHLVEHTDEQAEEDED